MASSGLGLVISGQGRHRLTLDCRSEAFHEKEAFSQENFQIPAVQDESVLALPTGDNARLLVVMQI